jgi:predicted PurR-regulated permease PerM
MMPPPLPTHSPSLTRSLLIGLLVLLVLLCAVIMQPFLSPLAWAAVLVYVTWPVYRLVLRLCRERNTLAAAVMTLLDALVAVGPLSWFTLLLQSQLGHLYQLLLSSQTAANAQLPELIRRIPWLGEALQSAVTAYGDHPELLRQWLVDWLQRSRPQLLDVFGSVGRSVALVLLTFVISFFLYRDGIGLSRQAGRVINRYFDTRLDRYVTAAGNMTRAVVYGYLSTGLIQGIMAAVGFAIFGVGIPVLLGALTTLASAVPIFGTLVVWGSVSLWLVLTGHLWQGLGLLAWGTLLVHPVDNILRPLLISNTTHIPFLLVMFGVVGGVAAFGLVGVFVGPVVLAVATAVWRELLEERGHG